MPKKLLVAMSMLLNCCHQGSQAPDAKPAAFNEAKSFVVASLKDPDSANFRNFQAGTSRSICGAVNARNSYGGYTGFSPFVYSPEGPVADRLYIYTGEGDWNEKGIMAEIFAERGCTIGADQAKALNARRLLAASDRRIAAESP